MSLTYLQIKQFRNLTQAQCEFLPKGFNFIHGDNGSGKTSLLEAIHFLGVGRSFRTSTMERLISHHSDQFLLFARTLNIEQENPIGVERHRDGNTSIRIRGKEATSMAELIYLLPIRLINSSCHTLLEGEPLMRRKFIDWGLFYQTEDFLPIWRTFNRTLKQRNRALLQNCSKNEISIWTKQLIEQAYQIDALRRHYISALLPHFNALLKELMPISNISSNYYSGWDSSSPYEQIIEENIPQDRLAGRTKYGPHRADLKLTINGIPAKDMLSRGQQKLFVCAMILAQGALLAERMQRQPIYLIDDLPSELDAQYRLNLVSLLTKQNTQIFITTIEPENFGINKKLVRMFHVKHGEIQTRPD